MGSDLDSADQQYRQGIRQMYALTAALISRDVDAMLYLMEDAGGYAEALVPVSVVILDVESHWAGEGSDPLGSAADLVSESVTDAASVLKATTMLQQGDMEGCDREVRRIVGEEGYAGSVLACATAIGAMLMWRAARDGLSAVELARSRCVQAFV